MPAYGVGRTQIQQPSPRQSEVTTDTEFGATHSGLEQPSHTPERGAAACEVPPPGARGKAENQRGPWYADIRREHNPYTTTGSESGAHHSEVTTTALAGANLQACLKSTMRFSS